MPAAAYIRRSSATEDSPGDVSRESQITAIRGLAMAAGLDPDALNLYEDWGKSADEHKKSKRTEYLRLLKDIEGEKYSHVFAYHTDRLIRSVADFTELTNVADGHTTVQVPGLTLTGSDAMARAFAQLSAVFAELELGRIKDRVRKGFAVRKHRGDDFGTVRYGYKKVRDPDTRRLYWERDPDVPLDRVLDIVKANDGNILASCRALDAEALPAPRGGRRWGTSALTRIVDREAPGLRPKRGGSSGQRRPTKSVLSGLVRCPFCDVFMTPVGTREALYCRNGSRQRDVHPKYFVKQHAILDLLHEQTDGKTFSRVRFTHSTPDSKMLSKAEERWRRANKRFQMGGISDGEYEAEARRWNEAQAKHRADDDGWDLEHLRGMPYVRWDEDVQTVNADLRRCFTEVRLDEQMRPVEAVWRWRHMRRRSRAKDAAEKGGSQR